MTDPLSDLELCSDLDCFSDSDKEASQCRSHSSKASVAQPAAAHTPGTAGVREALDKFRKRCEDNPGVHCTVGGFEDISGITAM